MALEKLGMRRWEYRSTKYIGLATEYVQECMCTYHNIRRFQDAMAMLLSNNKRGKVQ